MDTERGRATRFLARPLVALRGIVILVLAGHPLNHPLLGQDWRPCDSCEPIRWNVERILGPTSNSGSPSLRATVATNGDLYLVAPLDGDPDEITVHSASQESVLGRRGDGPGEFRAINRVVYGEGTFRVFSRARETLYDDTLNLITTRRVPVPAFAAVPLDSSRSVVQGWLRAREGQSGFLFHVIGQDGSGSFGPRITSLGRNPRAVLFALGPSPGPYFWAAAQDSYVFEKWSADGQVVKTLRPRSSTLIFERIGADEVIDPFNRRPPATVVALREDTQGRLWVATLVAKSDWRPTEQLEEGRDYAAALVQLGETIVEVIDIGSSRVIASQRIPRYIDHFIADGLAVARDVDAYDVSHLEVVRFTIQNEEDR